VRYALRGFRRNPGCFTITVIATLALGIGATTAVFSVVDRILFRSLPYAHDDRLVSVGLVQSLEKQEFMLGGFFFDWRDNQKPFEAFASQGTMPHACDLVGVQSGATELHPRAGRLFASAGNFAGAGPQLFCPKKTAQRTALWRSSPTGCGWITYNRDPGILNRQIDVDGSAVRVIGVLPKGFELPTLQAADVMLPDGSQRRSGAQRSSGTPMRAFARLKPGVSIEQARRRWSRSFSTRGHMDSAGDSQGFSPAAFARCATARRRMCS
jgi:putative ABC transport system permease protein